MSAKRRQPSPIALDIGTAVLRIEQLANEVDEDGVLSAMGFLLVERLQGDAQRLRGYLNDDMLQTMEEVANGQKRDRTETEG